MLGQNEVYRLVARTPKQLHWVFQQLERAKELAYDIETTHATANKASYHIPPTQAKVLGIAFCWGENQSAYIPIYKNGAGEPFFKDPLTHDMVVERLRRVLEQPDVDKIAQNGKFDNLYLYRNFGIRVRGFMWDTMVAHWVINENGACENWAGIHSGVGHGLDKIAVELLGDRALCGAEYDVLQQEVVLRDPKFKRYETCPVDMVGTYACSDVCDTFAVYKKEREILRGREQLGFFLGHEMRKTHLLIEAEITGLPIQVERIGAVTSDLEARMSVIRAELAAIVGFDFDPSHAGNTAYVLFDVLKLNPLGGAGKSGQWVTNKFVLERLSKTHEVPGKIIAYRNLDRMKLNYSEAMYDYIDMRSKRFFMDYRQTVVDTGRLSSAIIQSMPSEKKGGKIIKSLFWAGDGNSFVFADFSQIELRVMAELARDEGMVAAFKAGEDIHAATAKELLGVSDEWVRDPRNAAEFAVMRRSAKAINFGILFGEGAKKLSDNLGFADKARTDAAEAGKQLNDEQAHKEGLNRANKLIESYFEAYPGVKAKIEAVHREAGVTGVVRNMFGRIRHLNDIVELAQFDMPRYTSLALTQGERDSYYGRSGHERPQCFSTENPLRNPPTLSAHSGFDVRRQSEIRRPVPSAEVSNRLMVSRHYRNFVECAKCPFLGACAWEHEVARRRAKLRRNQRQAFSSLIQGTAVDMSMYAWSSIDRRIHAEGVPAGGTYDGLAKVVLHVHDELGVIVADSHASRMMEIVQEEMERWPNEHFPDWITPIVAEPSPPVKLWSDQQK